MQDSRSQRIPTTAPSPHQKSNLALNNKYAFGTTTIIFSPHQQSHLALNSNCTSGTLTVIPTAYQRSHLSLNNNNTSDTKTKSSLNNYYTFTPTTITPPAPQPMFPQHNNNHAFLPNRLLRLVRHKVIDYGSLNFSSLNSRLMSIRYTFHSNAIVASRSEFEEGSY
jgi:hypothetical protein